MTTLYSTVIKLLSTSNVSLPASGGQHGHAAFLDIVQNLAWDEIYLPIFGQQKRLYETVCLVKPPRRIWDTFTKA